jgi:hypothetical protein
MLIVFIGIVVIIEERIQNAKRALFSIKVIIHGNSVANMDNKLDTMKGVMNYLK